jgi:acyl-coenzyme A synthetase/AMP-(fatty) acid ligase
VAPAELEDILSSHPDVVEAAVCAVFDSSQQTEIPVGYVSLKPSVAEKDYPAVLERILQHTNGLVAPYKKIRGGLHYLPTIPKNPTGKVMRAALPARVEAAKVAAGRVSKL